MKKYLPILLIFIFTLSACTCTQVDGKWVVNGECYGDLDPCADSSYDVGDTGLEWAEGHFEDIYATDDVIVGGDLSGSGDFDWDHADTHEWDYLQDGVTRYGIDEVDTRDSMMVQPALMIYAPHDTGFWNITSVGTGSASSALTFLRSWTGAVVGSQGGICSWAGIWIATGSGTSCVRCSGYMTQDSIANAEGWFGFYDTNNVYPAITSNHIAFYHVNGVIYASNGNGVAGTQTNTGVTFTGPWNKHEMYFKYMPTEIRFYIDKNLVATHTTNRPDGLNMYLGVWTTNTAAANKTTYVDGSKFMTGGE